MASISTDIFSSEKEWLHTVTENSFETGDGVKVNKEWFDTISYKEISGSEFKKESFVKSKEANFFSHCIKKLQQITATGCFQQYILK